MKWNMNVFLLADLSPPERGSFHQLQKRQRPHSHVGDPGAVPDPAARTRHGAAGLHPGPRLHAQVGPRVCAWKTRSDVSWFLACLVNGKQGSCNKLALPFMVTHYQVFWYDLDKTKLTVMLLLFLYNVRHEHLQRTFILNSTKVSFVSCLKRARVAGCYIFS